MIFRFFRNYSKDRRGLAATEFALILPIMLTLLLGMIDLGTGITVKKKAIGAAQIAGDLLTRTATVTQAQIDDAVYAGQLAMAPYPVADYGIDIASVEFTGDPAVPSVLWRETVNREPNPDIPDNTNILKDRGEGVVVVSVSYRYVPLFVGFITDVINIEEVAFSRGRRSSAVRKE